jgi:hypothetical protein
MWNLFPSLQKIKRNLITSGSAIDLQSRPEIIIIIGGKIKAGAAPAAEGGIFTFFFFSCVLEFSFFLSFVCYG